MNIFSSSDSRHSRNSRSTPRNFGERPSRRPRRAAAVPEGIGADTEEVGWLRLLGAALFALPVAAILGFLLLLVMTWAAYAQGDPDSLTLPLSRVALGLTAILGGLVAARRSRVRPLVSGGLLGILLLLLLLCLSRIWGQGDTPSTAAGYAPLLRWIWVGGIPLLSLLGGKLAVVGRGRVGAHSPRRDRRRHRR